ncbi:hypothetical protein HGA91_03690 [candidate division WWE3 bacterium]|nr:hypothetical protein [candidate division WWE3 bacterium]
MAEPFKAEVKTLAEIFAEAYNREKGTKFIWDDYRSHPSTEPADFRLYDSNMDLPVQLKRLVENEDRDFVRPKYAEKVIIQLQDKLDQRGIRGVSLHLNFENQPHSSEDIDKLAYWITELVAIKTDDALSGQYVFRFDFRHDPEILKRIEQYISDIDIVSRPDRENVVIGWAWSQSYPEPLLDDIQRVQAQVSKVENMYHNVILLLDSYNRPISDKYIPWIKDSLKNTPINEVWVVDNYSSVSRAIHLK